MPSRAGCGKIKYCMDTKIDLENEKPPRIDQAIVKGFNTIANHAYLLILPFLLDIFLWLGPRLSISQTLNTFFSLMEQSIKMQLNQPGMADQFSQFQLVQPALKQFADSFNLFGFLTTTPIGVPSLLSFTDVLENPFGLLQSVAVNSIAIEFIILIGLLMIGSLLGGIYLSEIGRCANQNQELRQFSFIRLMKDIGWLVLLNFTFWIAVILLLIPSMAIAVAANLVSAFVGNILYFVILLILFWLLIPLIFTPHGVIVQQQNPLKAMLSSIRLIRFYLPGTGFFIMFSLLTYQIMNQFLWLLPKTSSYMLLGGIFGHSFICTGLIASSFMYYQDGLRWMNHNLKMIAQQSNQTSRPFQA
jgi:hypothetical protein